jgi:hypothetical protein
MPVQFPTPHAPENGRGTDPASAEAPNSEKNPQKAAPSSKPGLFSPQARKRRRKSPLFRILSFVLMLVLILGAVAVVVFRDQLNIDALRRSLAYRQMERNDSGQCEEFEYDSEASNQFASYQNGLLVASATGITLLDQSGQTRFSEKAVLASPIIHTGGDNAVVYDAGGRRLVLFSGMEVGLTLELEEGQAFFSASLNDSGYLTAVSQATGYKAAVNVYNEKQQHIFCWNSSSRFVTDAAVFNDCKTMAAVTIGQENAQYESTLVFYRLNSEEQYASLSLGNHLVLAIKPVGSVLCVLADDALMYVSQEGELLATYDYQAEALNAFSLGGDGYSVIELGKYQAGSLGKLITIDPSGEEIASLPLSENIISLSADGRYIAVLFSGHLDIYDSDLKLYATLENTDSTRNVLMRSDGSVMCVGAGSARLYLP